MSTTESKVDMAQLREAARKVFVFKPPAKSERVEQRTQHRDKQTSFVKESKAPYKTEKRQP